MITENKRQLSNSSIIPSMKIIAFISLFSCITNLSHCVAISKGTGFNQEVNKPSLQNEFEAEDFGSEDDINDPRRAASQPKWKKHKRSISDFVNDMVLNRNSRLHQSFEEGNERVPFIGKRSGAPEYDYYTQLRNTREGPLFASKRSHHAIPGSSISDYAMDMLYNAYSDVLPSQSQQLTKSSGNSRSFVGRRSNEYLPMSIKQTPDNNLLRYQNQLSNKLNDMESTRLNRLVLPYVSLMKRTQDSRSRNMPYNMDYNMETQPGAFSDIRNSKRDDISRRSIGDYATDALLSQYSRLMEEGNSNSGRTKAFVGKRKRQPNSERPREEFPKTRISDITRDQLLRRYATMLNNKQEISQKSSPLQVGKRYKSSRMGTSGGTVVRKRDAALPSDISDFANDMLYDAMQSMGGGKHGKSNVLGRRPFIGEE